MATKPKHPQTRRAFDDPTAQLYAKIEEWLQAKGPKWRLHQSPDGLQLQERTGRDKSNEWVWTTRQTHPSMRALAEANRIRVQS